MMHGICVCHYERVLGNEHAVVIVVDRIRMWGSEGDGGCHSLRFLDDASKVWEIGFVFPRGHAMWADDGI